MNLASLLIKASIDPCFHVVYITILTPLFNDRSRNSNSVDRETVLELLNHFGDLVRSIYSEIGFWILDLITTRAFFFKLTFSFSPKPSGNHLQKFHRLCHLSIKRQKKSKKRKPDTGMLVLQDLSNI